MRNRGVRRPGLSLALCAAAATGGALAIAWGVWRMDALGIETAATSASIGLGIVVAMLGALLSFNFAWALRLVRALRRGDGVIARWTVAPATFEMFRDLEDRLRSQGDDNDLKVPRRTPPAGLDIVFSADAVLIGDTFFGLASTGFGRFSGVWRTSTVPPCLEFGTVLTWASNTSTLRIHHTKGVLRVPIAHDAGAAADRVLAHYQNVIARRTIVKPHFWRTRIRLGLGTAIVSGLAAAAGFALAERDQELGHVPLAMAVCGTMIGIGGLVLALAAWGFHRHQRRG
jgi:ABC-type glycerol-3-phosphate transport system permease component